MLKIHTKIDFKICIEFMMKKTWKLTSQGPPKWLPKSMKIHPWSSQGSPGIPKRLKDAPMPPKRSPRDQKCLPKSSKTAPKINKKRYLQLPESLDPSQNHIISNCLLKVFNHPIIKSSIHRIIQSSSHRVIKSSSNYTIIISRIIESSSRQLIQERGRRQGAKPLE